MTTAEEVSDERSYVGTSAIVAHYKRYHRHCAHLYHEGQFLKLNTRTQLPTLPPTEQALPVVHKLQEKLQAKTQGYAEFEGMLGTS